MNRWIARTAASLALLTLTAGLAFAAPPKKAKPAAMDCPVCKMPLSTKKTKDNPVAVYVKGKTLYCCSKCKMDKSLTTKPSKPHHKGGHKM